MNKHIKISELCMILDMFTGENIRFAECEYNFGSIELAKINRKSIGTIKEALDFLKKYPHEWKWIIVKLQCIVSPNLAGIEK